MFWTWPWAAAVLASEAIRPATMNEDMVSNERVCFCVASDSKKIVYRSELVFHKRIAGMEGCIKMNECGLQSMEMVGAERVN